MGTEYKILDQNGNTMSCDEMSTRFGLEIFSPVGELTTLSRLTPEQIVEAGVELLKVASYHMDKEELQKAIEDIIEAKGGYRMGVTV